MRTKPKVGVKIRLIRRFRELCHCAWEMPALLTTHRMKSRSDQISWRWQLPSATWVTRGHVYSSCVLSAMLHASETWQLTKKNLQRNDRAMIRQICTIKPEDVATVRSSELLAKFELEDLDLILRERRLRWFRHVERSSGGIRTACDIQIDGMGGGGGGGVREAQANME